MAAVTIEDKGIWLGGSDVTYNYNGIAYNGSGGVPPLDRITVFESPSGNIFQTFGDMPAVMDLRGVAQINDNEVIIAGGMESGQQVSNKVWRIQLDNLTGIEDRVNEEIPLKAYPNPAVDEITIETGGSFELKLYQANGSLVIYKKAENHLSIPTSNLASGHYWLEIISDKGLRKTQQVFIK